MDTIFALASAQGRSGVSVIRVSGPEAFEVARGFRIDLPDLRKAGLRRLLDADGALIDEALVLRFAGPNSFTGEDVVELHVHGSTAVVRAVLRELGQREGARLAEPGEFTRRALENNRLDLTQVEGLANLIDAETDAQRKQAVQVLSGAVGAKVEGWRQNLIRAAALLEATIDFADEEVPVDVTPEVMDLLERVLSELAQEISGSIVAEQIRTGFEVAIVGPPNAGKSTLLNRLAGRDAAITSEIAGTTRDIIEVRMDIAGLPVTFLDTAGLRQSDDKIETIGIERALHRARNADLRVFLRVPGEDLMLLPQPDDLVLTAKSDLRSGSENGISGKTGAGVTELVEAIRAIFEGQSDMVGVVTHERHRTALSKALDNLKTAKSFVEQGPEMYDVASEDIRSGTRTLEHLVGRVDVEAVLDEIFSSFCLGK